MKTTKPLITAVLTLLSILLVAAASYPEAVSSRTTGLAIFPFNDVRNTSLDLNIPAVLHGELSEYPFIEIVPVEVIRKEIYEIEPSLMWTGMKGKEKRGGILWRIEPAIIEKVNDRVDAQFTLYGDIIRDGDRWRSEVILTKKGDMNPERFFSLSGKNESELALKLKELSLSIAAILREYNVLREAEEDIRQYMGGMQSYQGAIALIKKHTESVPGSVPVRGLLLDLYLRERNENEKHILNEGQQIIGMLEQADDEDVRYLLSLDLDPFDSVAEVLERRERWEDAIYIRNKALRSFPYKYQLHKERLGRDHYMLAVYLEQNDMPKKALENYKLAGTYLQPLSDFSKKAKEGTERLSSKAQVPNNK